MATNATLGLELPCPTHVGEEAVAFVHVGNGVVLICSPCTGRLFPPRTLGRELKSLLRTHVQRTIAQADALKGTSRFHAGQLIAAAKGWAKRMQREHLTPHHLRVPHTESLHCWQLPACVYAQLLRQLREPPDQIPHQQRISVRVLVPITGRMRLFDLVSAHLRGPQPSASGRSPWISCADERVRVHWGAGNLMVCLE